MDPYEEAKRLMNIRVDAKQFSGGCSEMLIREAEERLDIIFPSSYKKFLAEFGSGAFGGSEFFGIVKNKRGEMREDGLLNVLSKTISARKRYSLPSTLIPISELGDGAVYCLDCSKPPVSPVLVYWSTFPKEVQEYEVEAVNFEEFFLNKIKIALDVLQSN